MSGEPFRPDPDALLAQVAGEERGRKEGRLKVFLGASPGVGKTFAMLETAHALHLQGRDVMVGVVETHGRAETAALREGIPDLPKRPVEYRGTKLEEFDLDAALAIHPDVLVLDELAHTNAPGSRHDKRWQDVEELLGAGIDVLTTINIQHVESLNDVVAQITGITVRETVPDAVLERADEVELVDLSPEVLHQRLREGKVYLPDRAERALEQFFKESNLTALRELALRKTAELVDARVQGWRSAEGARAVWPVTERLMVAVGPSGGALQLVRAARRMAAALRAEWYAVHVETPAVAHDRAAQEAAHAALRLAESLGGTVVTLSAVRTGDELLAWARSHNVTRILIGRPLGAWWKRWLRPSLLDHLTTGAGNIEVHVLPGEGKGAPPPGRSTHRPPCATGRRRVSSCSPRPPSASRSGISCPSRTSPDSICSGSPSPERGWPGCRRWCSAWRRSRSSISPSCPRTTPSPSGTRRTYRRSGSCSSSQ